MASLSYLSFVSLILVPSQVVLLLFLCLGIARRQIYYVMSRVIEYTINVNGMKIKLFPCLSIISAFCFISIYFKLGELQENHNHQHANQVQQDQGEFSKILYQNYRNMLIHLTNIVLVIQCHIAAVKYEDYMNIKDKFESTKKAQMDPKK